MRFIVRYCSYLAIVLANFYAALVGYFAAACSNVSIPFDWALTGMLGLILIYPSAFTILLLVGMCLVGGARSLMAPRWGPRHARYIACAMPIVTAVIFFLFAKLAAAHDHCSFGFF